MNQSLKIPSGKFAGEDAAAKKRRELRERLSKGETVKIAKGGSAMANGGEATVEVGKGKLASEDVATRKRREIRELLRQGEFNSIVNTRDTMPQNSEVEIELIKGVFASQWYEADPTLLTMEKIAMERNFPQFSLDKLDDGRLCWVGVLEPGVYESKFGQKRQYHVMAVYDNNHPNQKMGSSVKVYPLMPDVDELIASCGFRPFHLLKDSVGNLYLCTNEARDQKVGITTTTAASVLGWATKWLIAFELVLTGDLPLEDFNQHGGI